MNKHQIINAHWRGFDPDDVIFVFASSFARGWFNYRTSNGTVGMIRKDKLREFYTRVE